MTEKIKFHYGVKNRTHDERCEFITEGIKFHHRKYWLSCCRRVIHYGNLNSLRKFELITEEYKSITGNKIISLRILNFITKNQSSL